MSEKVFETKLGPLPEVVVREWLEINWSHLLVVGKDGKEDKDFALAILPETWFPFLAEIGAEEIGREFAEKTDPWFLPKFLADLEERSFKNGEPGTSDRILDELIDWAGSESEKLVPKHKIGFAFLRRKKLPEALEWLNKGVEFPYSKFPAMILEKFVNAGFTEEGLEFTRRFLPFADRHVGGARLYSMAKNIIAQGEINAVWELLGRTGFSLAIGEEFLQALLEYYLEDLENRPWQGAMELYFKSGGDAYPASGKFNMLWKQFQVRRKMTYTWFNWQMYGEIEPIAWFLDQTLDGFEWEGINGFNFNESHVRENFEPLLENPYFSSLSHSILSEYAQNGWWHEIQEGIKTGFFQPFDGYVELYKNAAKDQKEEKAEKWKQQLNTMWKQSEAPADFALKWWSRVSQEEAWAFIREHWKSFDQIKQKQILRFLFSWGSLDKIMELDSVTGEKQIDDLMLCVYARMGEYDKITTHFRETGDSYAMGVLHHLFLKGY